MATRRQFISTTAAAAITGIAPLSAQWRLALARDILGAIH